LISSAYPAYYNGGGYLLWDKVIVSYCRNEGLQERMNDCFHQPCRAWETLVSIEGNGKVQLSKVGKKTVVQGKNSIP
jgi:hypothetical protein